MNTAAATRIIACKANKRDTARGKAWPAGSLVVCALLAGCWLSIPASAFAAPEHAKSTRNELGHSAVGERGQESGGSVLYPPLAFAVVTDLPLRAQDTSRAQALLQEIGEHGKVDFTVHLGNIKGATEPCTDTLFAQREALLQSSPVPLIYIPGQHDWVDCANTISDNDSGSRADPVERLDTLRDGLLSGSMAIQTSWAGAQGTSDTSPDSSLNSSPHSSPDASPSPPLRLIRQSELPAFRPYRENTRWIDNGIVFVTLNVPADNNHFFDGGGRNGEFEDREIANRAWISRAATDARRRHARGLVFFFQGDPRFTREARRGFSWWFGRSRERDGFRTLRQDLVAAARAYSGPVLLIHAGIDRGDAGFDIEPMLHERNGRALHNMRRLEVDAPPHLTHWVRVSIGATHANESPSAFHVRLEQAPIQIEQGGAGTHLRQNATNDSSTTSQPQYDFQSPHTASQTASPAGNPANTQTYPASTAAPVKPAGPNNITAGGITMPTLLPLPPLDMSAPAMPEVPSIPADSSTPPPAEQ